MDLIIPSRVLCTDAAMILNDFSHTVVTHDGRFHADEVFAVALLLQLPEFKNYEVIRTRDSRIIEKAAVVIDVGNIYDAQKCRFDHHQHDFNHAYNENYAHISRLSSCGLIYKHYAESILASAFKLSEDEITLCKDYIYETFILALDACDNGVNLTPAGINPLYRISTDLPSRIFRLNPVEDKNFNDSYIEKSFLKAMRTALEEFSDYIEFLKITYLPQAKSMRAAFLQRYAFHPSGRVLNLDTRPIHLTYIYALEKSENLSSDELILFVVYPAVEQRFRVRAINTSPESFDIRTGFPPILRGRNVEDLKTQLPGLRFVHRAGFLAEVEDLKSAFALIDMTLELPK